MQFLSFYNYAWAASRFHFSTIDFALKNHKKIRLFLNLQLLFDRYMPALRAFVSLGLDIEPGSRARYLTGPLSAVLRPVRAPSFFFCYALAWFCLLACLCGAAALLYFTNKLPQGFFIPYISDGRMGAMRWPVFFVVGGNFILAIALAVGGFLGDLGETNITNHL